MYIESETAEPSVPMTEEEVQKMMEEDMQNGLLENEIKGKERKMKRYILTTAMVFGAMTMSAEAVCTSTYCTDDHGIYRVLPTSQGVLLATFGNERKLACKAIANAYISLPKTNPNYKALYSTILAGIVGRKSTTLRAVANSKTGKCELTYAYLTNKK